MQWTSARMLSLSVVSNSLWLHVLQTPGSSVHGISQAGILEWVAITSSRRFSQLEDQTQSPGLAGGFFTTESPGKPEEDLSMMLDNSIFLNIY